MKEILVLKTRAPSCSYTLLQRSFMVLVGSLS